MKQNTVLIVIYKWNNIQSLKGNIKETKYSILKVIYKCSKTRESMLIVVDFNHSESISKVLE